MRHQIAGQKLSRSPAQRKALFRNLIRELYIHERITTTQAKARAVRSDAEKLITKAKHGLSGKIDRVHAQRQVVAYLNDKSVASWPPVIRIETEGIRALSSWASVTVMLPTWQSSSWCPTTVPNKRTNCPFGAACATPVRSECARSPV